MYSFTNKIPFTQTSVNILNPLDLSISGTVLV